MVSDLLRVSIERLFGLMAMPGHLRPMVSSFWPFHDLEVMRLFRVTAGQLALLTLA